MRTLQVLHPDGSPATSHQVIIKNPGEWDYGITDSNGMVYIPHVHEIGTVVVKGQTVYVGILDGIIYLPN